MGSCVRCAAISASLWYAPPWTSPLKTLPTISNVMGVGPANIARGNYMSAIVTTVHVHYNAATGRTADPKKRDDERTGQCLFSDGVARREVGLRQSRATADEKLNALSLRLRLENKLPSE